jgi:Flp pilus assembly protein TadG
MTEEANPETEKSSILSRIRRDESGLALVWMSLFMMVLMGFASLAIDISHGYSVAAEAQNAADAAALAGTIYLPDDPATAISTAQSVAAANGFPNTKAVVTAQQQSVTTQLKVTVTENVSTWFARAIGFKNMKVARSATADYDQPMSMGSPANTFGNQPDCTAPCTTVSATPQFWANVAGPRSPKGNGDRFASNNCPTDGSVDGCAADGTNIDYAPGGYVYSVNNATAGATLKIDAFDPGFFNVGDHCDGGAGNDVDGTGPVVASNLDALYAQTGNSARYASGDTTTYCTGDQYFTSGTVGTTVNPPWTSYRVYKPDATPLTLSDNIEITTCRQDFPGFVGDLKAAYLTEAATGPVHTWFRRWVTICNISGAQVGSYLVQIRTNAKADGTTTSAITSAAGHNRFSLRASLNSSLNSSAVAIAAQSNMSIYANATGASTSFYLARIMPGAAGRHVTVSLYDIGDAGAAGTVKVIPPADATVPNGTGTTPLTAFSGCQYTPPPGLTAQPWGTLTNANSDCSTAVSNTPWNGQVVEFSVPIPSGYNCTYTAATGCWVKLNLGFPAGTSVADSTTWTASVDGNPVRIVQ